MSVVFVAQAIRQISAVDSFAVGLAIHVEAGIDSGSSEGFADERRHWTLVGFPGAPQQRKSPVGEGPTQGGCWLNLVACERPSRETGQGEASR